MSTMMGFFILQNKSMSASSAVASIVYSILQKPYLNARLRKELTWLFSSAELHVWLYLSLQIRGLNGWVQRKKCGSTGRQFCHLSQNNNWIRCFGNKFRDFLCSIIQEVVSTCDKALRCDWCRLYAWKDDQRPCGIPEYLCISASEEVVEQRLYPTETLHYICLREVSVIWREPQRCTAVAACYRVPGPSDWS